MNQLIEYGLGQIRVSSVEIFQQSFDFPYASRLIGGVLRNETDPLFAWQFNPKAECPIGCRRMADGSCGTNR